MRKILAHTFALLQGHHGRGIDLGALALVGEIGKHAVHQVQRCLLQAAAWGKAGAGVVGKFMQARHHGRGKHKFTGTVKRCTRLVVQALAHLLPRHAALRHGAGAGADFAGGQHAQLAVWGLQVKVTAGVAIHIGHLPQVQRGRLHCQVVVQHLLRQRRPRREVGHVLRGLYQRLVVVDRFVRYKQFHAAPTLVLTKPLWVK